MAVIEQNNNGTRREQLVIVLVALVTDFLRSVRRTVLDADTQNIGRVALGAVPGREASEDEYLEVDKISEDSLGFFCSEVYREHGISFWVRSEHFPEGYGIGCERQEDAEVECDIDPFDGTDQYRKRLRSAWWSVLTFSQAGVPLLGGAVDILGGAIYRGYDGKAEEILIRTNQRTTRTPKTETRLNAESVVASYKGKWSYFFPWVGRVTRMFSRKELAAVTHYGDAGSMIYPLIATGVVSAYIMDVVPGEPKSEISPGAGFVQAGNLCALVVKGRNIRKFDPLCGMTGRVDGILIVACTEELAMSIARKLRWSWYDSILARMLEKAKNICTTRRFAMQST